MKGLVVALLSVSLAQAQQYVISTYAGGPRPPGANTSGGAGSLATDTSGNLYFAGNFSSNPCVCVFKLDPNGVLTRIAGSPQRGFSGDGGPATSAQLSGPMGLAVDGVGNLFIADAGGFYAGSFPNGYSGDRIRKVSPDGIITTVAGGGALAGSAADGGLATNAELFQAFFVAADSVGNVFISESPDDDGGGSNRIRKVTPDGVITTVVGNGMFGFAGDGGPAISAQLNGPSSLAVDNGGNLFFVDSANQRIRKVSADGTITTVVDARASINLSFDSSVTSLSVDAAGNLFFNNFSNGAVFKLSPAGVTTTVVGGDSGPNSWALAVDGANNLFLTGFSRNLIKVSPDGFVTTLLGNGACCYAGDGGPATSAQLQQVNSVAADSVGNLFIADSGNHRIRKVDAGGTITTVAGNGTWNALCGAMTGDSEPAASAQLCAPSQVSVDGIGNIFIVDRNRIRKVSPDGTITSIAGDGTMGSGIGGDGMPAAQALAYPNSVAVDSVGNIYFAEWARVRKITPDGVVTTVAGTGTPPNTNGCSPPESPSCGPPSIGDGQPATSVQLFGPKSVTVDGAGNIYFVDGWRIRKVTPDGIITTVAGNGVPTGYHGPTGDGGPAIDAPLWTPNDVTLDSAGNLYISEPVRIRKVTIDGTINTIAGTQDPGYSGDGGLANKAQLGNPSGLTVDGGGNVYFADSSNNVIRVLRPVP
jgi:sugar lactone lactonase YvrE